MSKRKNLPEALRWDVLNRDEWTCHYCGRELLTAWEAAQQGRRCDQYEVDHIVPVAEGGENVLENLVAACLSCNRSKCARSYSEFTARRR